MTSLPYPPRHLMERVGAIISKDVHATYAEFGRQLHDTIVAQLPPGWSFAGKRVLDFGCRAGCVLRHFVEEARQADEFWGCDIDRASTDWLTEHLAPPFRIFHNGELPPLDVPDAHFDLVYAMSVFTHIAKYWAEWLCEMHRVLRPGGLLVVSLLMPSEMASVLGVDPTEDVVGMTVMHPGVPWDEGGPIVFQSNWWLRAHWGRAFEFLGAASRDWILPSPCLGQRVFRLRPRAQCPSPDALLVREPGEPRECEALSFNLELLWQMGARFTEAQHSTRRQLQGEVQRLQGVVAHWSAVAEAWQARHDGLARPPLRVGAGGLQPPVSPLPGLLEALPDVSDVRAALSRGEPVLVCERPGFRAGDAAVAGELVVSGFAADARGVASVEVEVGGRGRAKASIGLSRPDARLFLNDLLGASRPGFEARLVTDDWAPGRLPVRVSLRTTDGRTAVWTGLVHWIPSVSALSDAYESGRPVLWWHRPEVDPTWPLGRFVRMQGWAAACDGIQEVRVEGPHGRTVTTLRPGLDTFGRTWPAPLVAYRATLDLKDVPPGEHEVVVTAIDGKGSQARRVAALRVDPDANYRAWRAAQPAPPVERAPALLLLCVVGDSPGTGARLAAGQSHSPVEVLVTTPAAGLGKALRALLERGDTAALVLAASSDSLHPSALACIGATFAADPPPDLVYADDDEAAADGGTREPRLKPGWSPDLFLARDEVGALVAIGRRAARLVLDGWPAPPATARELVLRLVEAPLRAVRLPFVLCTRHAPAPSEPEAEAASLQAIAARRGRRVVVEPTGDSDARLRWPLDEYPLVSIVIPTTGAPELLDECLPSLVERTAYRSVEFVLVDSGGQGGAERACREHLQGRRYTVVPYDARGRFNFSRAVNLGWKAASGGLLLFLNDDTQACEPGWLEAMAEYATLPGVGAVGARLLYPDGTLQHGGVTLHQCGRPGGWGPSYVFGFLPGTSTGPRRLLAVARNVAAVTGACMLVPRAALESVGGWDEDFALDFGDIDLCVRVIAAGYRCVMVPWATVIHRENATRTKVPLLDAGRRFFDRWGRVYRDGDPWYHPAYEPDTDYELVRREPFIPPAPRAPAPEAPAPTASAPSSVSSPARTIWRRLADRLVRRIFGPA